ncbi:MAG TPA: 2-oxoacid:acceptor oxidoreductase family protein [Acidimicrobiales bacterium]|nr:2-oxoacid:acceptor oxidoreductase family protein [Acidimicrobiales bacterium]
MAERELALTGIGGQGVQFAAQVMSRGAIAEGRQVMMFGSYGGMMRGGNTDATLVVADGPIESPPTVPRVWAAMVMHHEYWSSVQQQLRAGSVVFVNSTIFRGELDPSWQVIELPVTDIAVDVGNIMGASMVMAGAISKATGFVSLDCLLGAVEASLPSYRAKHVAINHEALRAGFAAIDADVAPAWAARVGA